MKSNIKLFDKVSGHIKIHSENIKTGEHKEYPEVHNLILTDFMREFFQSASGIGNAFLTDPGLRCGSGSTEPSVSDTALGSDYMGSWYPNNSCVTLSSKRLKVISLNSVELTFVYVLPATATFVGELTELGLWISSGVAYKNSNNYWTSKSYILFTHSLLKDAESQPYSINKTDLDQLTIEYKVSFSSQVLPIALLTRYWAWSTTVPIPGSSSTAGLLKDKMQGLANFCNWGNYSFVGGVGALRKYHSVKKIGEYLYGPFTPGNSSNDLLQERLYDDFYNTDIGQSTAPSVGDSHTTCLDDQGHMTIPARRLPVNWDKNRHYILGFHFSVNSYGFFTIYDKSLFNFTEQALEDYSVGVGDGVTTDFRPPLSHWKPNTEKIYIDGILQTRGVDYTCDPNNNVDNLAELLPLHHATVIDSEWSDVVSDYYGIHYVPGWFTPGECYITGLIGYICDAPAMSVDGHDGATVTKRERYPYKYMTRRHAETFAQNSNQVADTYPNVKIGVISTCKPTIFELPLDEVDIPWAVNTVYLYLSANRTYVTFSVYYSNDLETWTQACNKVTAFKSGRVSIDPTQCTTDDWCEYSIGSDVTARYWKLEMHYDPETTPTGIMYYGDYFGFCIKHKGTDIQFTNPPADGAIITMDADTDIIFKDENTVIDVGATFSM